MPSSPPSLRRPRSRRPLALLRDSITASLADDRLVRQWIVARYDGNVAADSLWQAQLEASRAASEAKRAFRAEYADRLAAQRALGLHPRLLGPPQRIGQATSIRKTPPWCG